MSEKKFRVGLVVLTEIPSLGLVAVLQARGPFNLKKMAPESYPGICEITVFGNPVPDSENFFPELWQATTTLGENFTALIHEYLNEV